MPLGLVLVPRSGRGHAAMRVLYVDDSLDSRLLVQSLLDAPDDPEVVFAASAAEAFSRLGVERSDAAPLDIDLVLMDVRMPGVDGLDACRRIRAEARLADIPVIMMTADTDEHTLEAAFAAGAVDYIAKPVRVAELRARVASMLRLKQEMDRRKEREAELEEVARQLAVANTELMRLTFLDGLTGVANRRGFDECIGREWGRGLREHAPVALILVDVDHFKAFNDRYGHLAGDDCLKQVAQALKAAVHRPSDFVARYGGEEFAVVLPGTEGIDAASIAETLRSAVEALAIPHAASITADRVTVSLGIASLVPLVGSAPQLLVDAADRALYAAKHAGRNQSLFPAAAGGMLHS